MRHQSRWFAREENGSILVETLLVIPVVVIMTVGFLEFGNVLWQRHQVQAGVRDAARYWSRCFPAAGSWTPGCNIETARSIAFYGIPNGGVGDPLRVPGWFRDEDLTILPATPSSTPGPTDLVTVTAATIYQGSPIFGFLRIPEIEIGYTHQERFIGW